MSELLYLKKKINGHETHEIAPHEEITEEYIPELDKAEKAAKRLREYFVKPTPTLYEIITKPFKSVLK